MLKQERVHHGGPRICRRWSIPGDDATLRGVRPAALGSLFLGHTAGPGRAGPGLPATTRAAYARRQKPLRINSMELTRPGLPLQPRHRPARGPTGY